MTKQRGFTLMELMIVVAIIGVLAAITIPKYQDYVTTTKWVSDVSSLESLKFAIGLCLQENQGDRTRCDSGSEVGFSGMPTPTHATAPVSIVPNTAMITFTGTESVGGYVYAAEPVFDASGSFLVWQRDSSLDTIPFSILPIDQR